MLITYSIFMCCEYFNYITSCPVSIRTTRARLPLALHLLGSTAPLSSLSSSLLSSLQDASSILRIYSDTEMKVKLFLTFLAIWSHIDKLNETQPEGPTVYHQTSQLTEKQFFFVLSVFSSSYDNFLSKYHLGNARSKEGDELHGTWREAHHCPLGKRRPNH